MGKNIVEKIIAKAVGRKEVLVGEYLSGVRSNRPSYVTDTGNFNLLYETGVKKLFDPKRFMVVCGHHGAGGSMGIIIGENRSRMRRQAKELGIPEENIFDLGRQGIEHVISGEKCWPLPGTIYFSLIDGHVTTNGALGSFVVPIMWWNQPWYEATGYTWIQVPAVDKLLLKGKLQKGVTARDIVEYVIGELGPTGNTGHVMEWAGPLVDRMGMDGRFTLCSNAIFTGAWTAIIEPDETIVNYVKSHTKDLFEPIKSDTDAEFANTFNFDFSKLEPQIVPPPERIPSVAVSKFEGTKINKGFIGSCVNGRLEDMRTAAQILKGRKVHRSVQLNITPASVDIYNRCLREGIIQVFADAEVFVGSPCCGMCHGHNTPLGKGDVCLSTATHNHPGRAGSEESEIYLCSPATAAASAIAGKITDPRNFL